MASRGGEAWGERLIQFWAGICSHGHVLLCADEFRASQLQAEDSSGLASEGCKAALDGCRSTFFHLLPHQRRVLVSVILPWASACMISNRVLFPWGPAINQQLKQCVFPCIPHKAVGDLAERSPPRSQTRRLCLSFQQELLSCAAAVPGGLAGVSIAPASSRDGAGTGNELISEEEVARWLKPLPRMLWELGSMAPDVSKAALHLLVMVGRLAQPGGQLMQLLEELQNQLVPFYVVARTKKRQSKGQRAKDSQGVVYATPGPLVELPADCQRLAVDLLWYYPSMTEATLRAVALMALIRLGRASKRPTTFPPAIALRAVEIVVQRCQQGAGQPHTSASVDLRAYLSFLVSLLIGNAHNLRPSEQWPTLAAGLSPGGKEHQTASAEGIPEEQHAHFWPTHQAIVKMAADFVAASSCSYSGTILGLLAPALQRELLSHGSRHPGGARAWYGLLASAAAAGAGSCMHGLPEELATWLPGAVVVYTLLCRKEDLSQSTSHPGLGPCVSLLENHRGLVRPMLRLIASIGSAAVGASGAEPEGQWLPGVHLHLLDSLNSPERVEVAAALLLGLCRSSELKEHLLNEGESMDKAVAALAVAAAAGGGATKEWAEAADACKELGSVRDSLFGRL
mmetsp:Transcript_8687/g.24984  ORF Transcript_8687/g.24984 Transcript_8687/m.24984 type:complete len:626 (-) Transcript_8687:159-2036(-)